jgi:hypothetical protein
MEMMMRPNRLGTQVVLVILLILSAVALGSQAVEAQEMQDVVYLRDGSVIRGTIVEQVPGVSLLIQTVDGNRFRYMLDQIERIAREPSTTLSARPAVQLKSPGAAGVLSALIPGAGQAYNGSWGRGAAFFFGTGAMYGATGAALFADDCWYNDECTTAAVLALGFVGIYVWNIVDAVKLSKRINAQGFALSLMPVMASGGFPWSGSRSGVAIRMKATLDFRP